jgi:hypothetical protein
VRILLDECVDWRLSRSIAGHTVKTARQMGWTAVKNGELLSLASAQFENIHYRRSKSVLSAECSNVADFGHRASRENEPTLGALAAGSKSSGGN